MTKSSSTAATSLMPSSSSNERQDIISNAKSRRGGLVVLFLAILALVCVGSREGGSYGPFTMLFVSAQCSDPCIPGNEDIMLAKNHGSSKYPVQQNLRWDCDWEIADRICNFNRHYAEYSGYWQSTTFLSDVQQNIDKGNDESVIFYDSGWKGSPLFTAPQNRTWDEFIQESKKHGWPSFRDSEVNWNFVRVLPGGETVSIDGTHLGHNIPDRKGNRYCINLVSVAGNPITDDNGQL